MTTLRPYQQEAISAVWDYLRTSPGNPLVELPTGAGKTPVLVSLAREAVEAWNGRVLILAHVKELLAQAAEKFAAWWPGAPVGLYSAGLGSRDVNVITVAGIQSVYSRAVELGHRDLVIVDECHLIPSGGDGMYLSLLRDLTAINPHVRVIGLTATPYRLDAGLVAPGPIFTSVAHRAKVRDLIEAGYLSPLRGKAGTEADLSSVHIRGGEFVAGELEAALADEETVSLACEEIVRHCADRKAWVIFCAGVKHAEMVADVLSRVHDIGCAIVTGETSAATRDVRIASFKRGDLRALININVLSTGFDAPHVDAVVMLRPTQSPGLYYQQVGRGLRLAPGKRDCLILDLAGNIRRHGPIDALDPVGKKKGGGDGEAPVKACPQCSEIVATAVRACPACGHEFPPPPVAKHETKADTAQPLSAPARDERVKVTGVLYGSHTKRGATPDTPRTLRVTYETGLSTVSEWVCFEHPAGGFARRKAEQWWAKRSPRTPPCTVDEALSVINDSPDFREPMAITVRMPAGPKSFPEITAHHFSGPCRTCAYFDAGACGKWNADVPEDAQAVGCEEHAPGAVTIPTDDEPPF